MLKSVCFVVLILLLSSVAGKSQESNITYTVILTPGDSARKAGDMVAAIKAYKESIASRPKELNDYYNLACAFSRVGEQDSAVKYLTQYITLSHDSTGMALTDLDFVNIRKSSKWPQLESNIINAYRIKNNVRIKDLDYAKALWHLLVKDQAYYEDIEFAKSKTGNSSTVVLALWDLKKTRR